MGYDDVRWLKMQNQCNLAQAKSREDREDLGKSAQNLQNKSRENHRKCIFLTLSHKLVRLTT